MLAPFWNQGTESSEYVELISWLPLSDLGGDFLLNIFYKSNISCSGIVTIINACVDIEQRFSGIMRKSGVPYIAHLYDTAKMLLEENENVKASEIVAALHHDSWEDTSAGFEYFKHQYGFAVAILVEVLTKPPIHWIDEMEADERNIAKKEMRDAYFWRFSSLEVLCAFVAQVWKEKKIRLKDTDIHALAKIAAKIKICDRRNNLSTMYWIFDTDHINRKIQETSLLINIAWELGISKKLRWSLTWLTQQVAHDGFEKALA